MNKYPCWIWRFSPQGALHSERCTDDEQYLSLPPGWTKIRPALVSKRLCMLAELHQQSNLYLMYRDRHPRPTLAIEPEHFQALFLGTAPPSACSPAVLRSLALAFFLPPSFFCLPRLAAIPRPFDGATNRRWDRMGVIQPTASLNDDATHIESTERRSKPRIDWHRYTEGASVALAATLVEDGTSFVHLHRAPILYVFDYTLDGETR